MLNNLLGGAAVGLLAGLALIVRPGLALRLSNVLELAGRARTRERVLLLGLLAGLGALVAAFVGPA